MSEGNQTNPIDIITVNQMCKSDMLVRNWLNTLPLLCLSPSVLTFTFCRTMIHSLPLRSICQGRREKNSVYAQHLTETNRLGTIPILCFGLSTCRHNGRAHRETRGLLNGSLQCFHQIKAKGRERRGVRTRHTAMHNTYHLGYLSITELSSPVSDQL